MTPGEDRVLRDLEDYARSHGVFHVDDVRAFAEWYRAKRQRETATPKQYGSMIDRRKAGV